MAVLRSLIAARKRIRTAVTLGIGLANLLSVSPSRALEYDYDAPPVCPQQQEFEDAVRRRLRYPAEQSSVERITVSVTRKGDFFATFVLTELDQAPVQRTVQAESCEQAIQALALAAALALDARYREVQGIEEAPDSAPTNSGPPTGGAIGTRARAGGAASSRAPAASPAARPTTAPAGEAAPEGDAETAAAPPPQAANAAPQNQPVRREPETLPPPALSPSALSPSASAPPSPAPSENRPTLKLQLGAFAATGYAPRASLGPSLGATLHGQLLELGVLAFYGFESRSVKHGQSAEFWVAGAQLRPCLRLDVGGPVTLKGCATLELSGVHAEGVMEDGVLGTEEALVPFWGLGLAAGLGVALSPSFSLEAMAGVQRPLPRRSFSFVNANGDLHEFPAVAVRADLGVCYAF